MFKICKTVTDKATNEVVDERVLKSVKDRAYAVFSMGFLVGKHIKDDPEENIIKAEIDDVLLSSGDKFIRYQMIDDTDVNFFDFFDDAD